jgi:hypothetical protein
MYKDSQNPRFFEKIKHVQMILKHLENFISCLKRLEFFLIGCNLDRPTNSRL